MKQILSFTHLLIGLVLITNIAMSQTNPKISRKLYSAIEKNAENQDLAAWFFFTDKGDYLSQKLRNVKQALHPNAIKRRERNRGAANLVDEYDVPVNGQYIREVARRVSRIRQKSRWLNAVSVEAKARVLYELSQLPFVKKLDLVYRKTLPMPRFDVPGSAQQLNSFGKINSFDYGASFNQNNQINVPALHDEGLTGEGIIIASLDAGFPNLEHPALDHLNILATWDFVNNDSNVGNEPGQMGNHGHGTWTLSVLGGFQEGQLIGPAFAAGFLLAKTEIAELERHVEEDNWVAAAEWADSLGADIISSSLGYRDFDQGQGSYTSEDMDGQTTIVTIGAEVASSRGILVVVSAGNEGVAQPGENTIVAPGDGLNVLAVGGVISAGSRISFSSMGPTADGRTKPDVMALAQGVVTASSSGTGYPLLNGTSFSCPLVAGAAALILQANPQAAASDIRNALRTTASNSAAPDNSLGWGIIDAAKASSFVKNGGELPSSGPGVEIFNNYPNPFSTTTTFRYNLGESGPMKIVVYNVLGQRVAILREQFENSGQRLITWNSEGLAQGIYFVVLTGNGKKTGRKMVLMR